nr:GGDEF and EAL domain-containing protein [Cellulomonas sp. KRMCY2]
MPKDTRRARAVRDPLTGLLGRQHMTTLLDAGLAADRTAGVSLLTVDIDHFTLLNDTAGHSAGDRVLATLGARLSTLARPGLLVGRFGGDEFLLALQSTDPAAVDELARAVLALVREPVPVADKELRVTASIGLATVEHGSQADTVLRRADLALQSAKASGRDQAAWFGEQQDADLAERMHMASLERDLVIALQTTQLQLHYQTAFDLGTGKVIGVEALLRWHHPVRGVIPPLEVIEMAEECGLIEPLGAWVIRTAMDQAALWSDLEGFTVWVNVSPRQLSHEGLAVMLRSELDRVGLPAHRFGIEVTESALAHKNDATAELRRVEALGVQVAIDDFGTGYSSLARLVRFPVDVIKIDRSFVNALGSITGDAVVNGIVTLAKGLGADVIAEGVETAQQLSQLRLTGCDAASGFLLARPVAVAEVALGASAWAAPAPVAAFRTTVPHQMTAAM